MTTSTDTELLQSYTRHHDEDAFRALVERYSGLVMGTARRKTGDHRLAEEITLLVFTALATKASRLENHPCLGGWLHRAASLESVRILRRESARSRKITAFAEHVAVDGDLPSESPWDAVLPILDDGLNALSAKDREFLLMRFYRGFDFTAIGETLGKKATAAQRQGHRVLEKLGKFFDQHRVTVSVTALATMLETRLHADCAATTVQHWATQAMETCAQGKPAASMLMQDCILSLPHLGTFALIAAMFPMAWQWSSAQSIKQKIGALEEERHRLEQDSTTTILPSTSFVAVGTEKKDHVEEIADILYQVITARDEEPSRQVLQRLEYLLDTMTAEEWPRLFARMGMFKDLSQEVRDGTLGSFTSSISKTAPLLAFDMIFSQKLPAYQAMNAFTVWAGQDFDAAENWLTEQRQKGLPDSLRLEKDYETSLLSSYVMVLSGKDLPRAMEFTRSLSGVALEKALVHVGSQSQSKDQLTDYLDLVKDMVVEDKRFDFFKKFAAGIVRTKDIPAEAFIKKFLDRVPVSATEKNRLLMAYGDRLTGSSVGDGNGEAALARVLAWSSDERRLENTKNIVGRLARVHYQMAVDWIESLEPGEVRSQSCAGLASGLSMFSNEGTWTPWVAQIEDPNIRAQTLQSIAKILSQIKTMHR
ncbi:MAG: RNA polymerase sigma factor (sigma-70 family) [Verrucomicrobiales bacterium]|jgi:RNA polymerase sigma factor (sigma-70 family)